MSISNATSAPHVAEAAPRVPAKAPAPPPPKVEHAASGSRHSAGRLNVKA